MWQLHGTGTSLLSGDWQREGTACLHDPLWLAATFSLSRGTEEDLEEEGPRPRPLKS